DPLVNGRDDIGAATASVVDRLNDVGCATLSQMPYDDGDYTTWPTSTAWVEALTRRTSSFNYIYMSNDTTINGVKQLLANGQVVVTRTDVYDNWYKYYAEAGTGISNWVIYSHSGSYEGGHAITIVGYDDTRAYTNNGTTKYGAFLIANSWGQSWGTYNTSGTGSKGYFWVAYDYIKSSGNFAYAYYNTDREQYRPSVYALTAISASNRSALTYTGGFGSTSSPAWISSQPPVSGDGGSNAITSAKPIAVDLTDSDSVITATTNSNFFVKLTSTASATLVSAALYTDFDGDGTYTALASSNTNVAISAGSSGYAQFSGTMLYSFSINNGDTTANARDVALNSICIGGIPQSYMASESSEFTGAGWADYATSVTFPLSSGTGTKQIYFKVKDSAGTVSSVVSDTIILPPPVVTAFTINNNAASCTTRTVTLNNTATGYSLSQYRASESSSFSDKDWQSYSTSPSFTLSTGNGTKTVYFQVCNTDNEVSDIVSDTITLSGPTVSSFSINNGAAYTTGRTITLNNVSAGSPTYYIASESSDFSDATWATYSSAPSFVLTTEGEGTKTVYFKVKNSNGLESSRLTDTITLYQSILDSFTINNDAITAENRVVTLNNVVSGSAEYYMASQSPSFAGAQWQKPYSTSPSFTLTGGNGTKTVYFKVKHTTGLISSAISDTIELKMPVISMFIINGGAALTTTQEVTLNNDCSTGSTPSEYMASESPSFVNAQWKAYSTAPSFTLSSSSGRKTVYFKVRNTTGQESITTLKDTITYSPPAVKQFRINAGASGTTTRTITLNNICSISSGTIVAYAASEDVDFKDVITSSTYSKAPIFSITTPGDGIKTVYFKVWNDQNQASAYKADTIILNELGIDSFAINTAYDTDTTVSTRAIRLASSYSAGAGYTTTRGAFKSSNPTQYMASESPTFRGASWKAYAPLTSFTLSNNSSVSNPASKTVYFKLRNVAGQTTSTCSTVVLDIPILKSVLINDGATTVSLTATTIKLSPTLTGTATQYMASQSSAFTNASWLDYSPTALSSVPMTFTTAGTKRVYFKVKNKAGVISSTVSDTIVVTASTTKSASSTAVSSTSANSTVSTSGKTGMTGSGSATANGTTSITGGTTTVETVTSGTTRVIALSNALDFSTVALGAIAQQTLTLANSGNAPLTVSDITYPNGFTGDWAGGSIAAGASQTVVVTFAPTAETGYAGNITVTSDKTSGTETLAVQGIGAKPNLVVTDSTLSATQLKVGDVVQATLTIGNASNFVTGKFHVALYFFTDDMLLEGTGYLVGEVAVDPLPAGGETTATWSCTMPDLLGTVRPVFALDSQSEITTWNATTNLVQSEDSLIVTP
ncbi:TPA: hypothetical protein DDW35_08790, partial [Candidatus Sumerlaeota bacterium]|nr:hypothetical protein [Candidatus Sumerlaeota bacterium]